MRLLDTHSLELTPFFGQDVPKYAILSHTWGEEEILFEDVKDGQGQIPMHKKGYAKVRDSCTKAKEQGYGYIWIDTCCIDKSSSAELSESINSMFKWYEASAVCYAYLGDVEKVPGEEDMHLLLFGSRWFQRGWTLQELIAPGEVEFFDRNWDYLGTRLGLAAVLSRITGIDSSLLHQASHDNKDRDIQHVLSGISIAVKMSWASQRHTTRLEDTAYCLMGLFGVNMPLLYGEGTKAFLRLQEEIMKLSNDHSILLYHRRELPEPNILFAPTPMSFAMCGDIALPFSAESEVHLTKFGMELNVLVCRCRVSNGPLWTVMGNSTWLALLDCAFGDNYISRPGLVLRPLDEVRGFYTLGGKIDPFRIDPGVTSAASNQRIIRGRPPASIIFDLSVCQRRKITILSSAGTRTTFAKPTHTLTAPMQLHTELKSYEVKYTFPEPVNGFISPGQHGGDTRLLGFAWITMADNDNFFIAWTQDPTKRVIFSDLAQEWWTIESLAYWCDDNITIPPSWKQEGEPVGSVRVTPSRREHLSTLLRKNGDKHQLLREASIIKRPTGMVFKIQLDKTECFERVYFKLSVTESTA